MPELVPPMMHVNIADWKRIKKARVKERREMSHKAATEYEEMAKNAHRGYETFHQLPEGSSPPACLDNSSAGILGWAKYMETIKATRCDSTGTKRRSRMRWAAVACHQNQRVDSKTS